MRNDTLLICFFLSLLLFCFGSCKENTVTTADVEKEIVIDTEKSFFSDFQVKNDKVYIYCTVLMRNFGGEEKKVTLKGVFPKDAENGLLKQKELAGYTIDYSSEVFVVEQGEHWIDVVFIGDFAGNNQKYSRLLPQIIIRNVN